MKNTKKILIIKTSSMGDIINTLPAITDAGYALPTAIFHWVIEENFSQIPTWHPKITKIIPINLRLWKKKYYHIKSYKEYLNFIYQLKKYKYDTIIDAQGLIKSALLITFFAKGEKHGMNYKNAREPIASFFYHKKHNIPKKQHTIERIRQLFSSSLKYQLPDNQGDYCISQNFKTKKHEHPYLIFLYNTTHIKKHWPESNWRYLIQIAIKSGYHIKLPYWSKHEKFRTERITYKLHSQITILHTPTLMEIAQQIASAYGIISVDTGLSHLTTALSRPNLTLYGPTDPQLIGIYGNKKQSIIRSKTKKMNTITPIEVWNTFQILIKNNI